MNGGCSTSIPSVLTLGGSESNWPLTSYFPGPGTPCQNIRMYSFTDFKKSRNALKPFTVNAYENPKFQIGISDFKYEKIYK